MTTTNTTNPTNVSTRKYVAYYRVSTKQQGQSGLGLEAQRADVRRFVNCEACIIAEFTEVESGKRTANRPELAAALEMCKRTGATLIVAKLDRLSRNAAFILTLKEAGVNFQCVDLPELNTLTLGVFASVAQFERERISERTKSALAAAKVRGTKLGNPHLEATREKATQAAKEARVRIAAERPCNRRASAMAVNLRAQGLTLQAIADELNKQGFETARGKAWVPTTIRDLLKRASA